ncbi:MAG: HD domain-containing protein [Candidatus Gracilibacteria bacterium]
MKFGSLETPEQKEKAIRRAIDELGLKRIPGDLIGALTQVGDIHFSHSLAVAVGVKHVLDGIGQITAPSMDGKSTVELDKDAIATGALLHDIGKYGPPGIDYKNGRNPFVIVYGLVFSRSEFMEIVKTRDPKEGSPSRMRLSVFLRHIVREKHITRDEAGLILQETFKVIRRPGIEDLTLRDFYNAHVVWTRQHLTNRHSVHQDTFLAAGCHHAARRFRFQNVDGRHADEHAVGAGKLVEVVDTMQAVTGRLERGKELTTFEQGLVGLQRMVARASGFFRVVQDGYQEFLSDKDREVLEEKLREEHERDKGMRKVPKRPVNLREDKIVRTGLLEEALDIANESIRVD